MFKVKNYNIIRKDRFDQQIGRGVAILLKKQIHIDKNNFVTYDNGNLETLIVSIMLNNKICNICTIYNPVKTISEEEFKYYFNLAGSNGLICGDFNAHNSLW